MTEYKQTMDNSQASQKQLETLQRAQSMVASYHENIKSVTIQMEAKKKEIVNQEKSVATEEDVEKKKSLTENLTRKKDELQALEKQKLDMINRIKELEH